MQEQPLVSVIIPVYNVEKYLRQCLDSVINQTLKNIEIICVDDGSTDNSLNILKEYKEKDNRIIILTQQNQYAGVARNNGLKIAKGKYLSFLDSDDFFDLNMLKEMSDKAEKNNLDVVVCEYNCYDNLLNKIIKQVKINKKFLDKPFFSFKNMPNSWCGVCNPNPWTKLFKHDLFLKYNLQFDNTICYNDFTCVYLALAVANKIGTINKPFVTYRMNQINNLSKNANKHRFEVNLKVMQSLYNNLKRLNIYNKFKLSFKKRAIKAFAKDQDIISKNKARSFLSKELFNLIYNSNRSWL